MSDRPLRLLALAPLLPMGTQGRDPTCKGENGIDGRSAPQYFAMAKGVRENRNTSGAATSTSFGRSLGASSLEQVYMTSHPHQQRGEGLEHEHHGVAYCRQHSHPLYSDKRGHMANGFQQVVADVL